MRTLLFAALLLLAGCFATTPSPPQALVPEAPAAPVPEELKRRCAGEPEIPPEPAIPRTVEQVLGWAYALEDALVEVATSLRKCRRRHGDLNDWIVTQVKE